MTDLQALIGGYLYGSLAAARTQSGFAIEAEVLTDHAGNYLPEILVRGLASGERVVIRIEALP